MDHPSDHSSGGGFSLDFDGSAPLQTGQVLFDRYIVERKLGEGGMGAVWLVRHREFDSERALKLIVSGIASDPQARARFRREARILDRLNHPNAVRVYDARLGKGFAFIEMEYVRGKSLNQILEPGVPMPLGWVADLLAQFCDVLQAANDEGIIHRDLKPPNLMLVEGRQPGTKVLKLLDFGIAKIREGGDDVRTMTGSFMGTPLYSSPEQIVGDTVDARSDIYSVGLILYELLTGQRPFSGSISAIIYKHTMVPPPPFAEVNPQVRVPAEVEQVVMRCLAKDPAERPQSPRELAAMFQHAVALATTAGPSTPLLRKTPPVITRWLKSPVRRRYPAWRILAGITLAVLLIVFVASSWPLFSLETSSSNSPQEADSVPDRIIPGSLPITEAQRIKTWVDRWAARGFKVDKEEGPLQGWPKVLIGPGEHRFPRSPSGIYLPEGYNPGSQLAGGRHPQTLTRKKDGTVFIRIEGGTFKMGDLQGRSEDATDDTQPAHEVKLSGFYMQKTEVTNREIEDYLKVVDSEILGDWKSKFEALKDNITDEEARKHPAAYINWDIASGYARLQGGMLPTEAQWEFAARSRGQRYLHVWGDKYSGERPTQLANLFPAADGTAPVGNFTRDVTEQGIHDLAGNVREWCRDVHLRYEESGQPQEDPQFPPTPNAPSNIRMVVRGGSISAGVEYCQTTSRKDPAERDKVASDLGFRIVIECPEGPPIEP